tara:strand:- start:201 stop:2474 length:2274 start_codon:yes stop_codon:yes gene_type:complete
MSIKALQDYTYVAKYARWDKKTKRRETWGEAVERVKAMHLKKYQEYPETHERIEWAFEQVRQKKVLGSQRALQFGGVPIEKKNARIYNCTVSFCDRIRFFQECFWLLLCGSGTGFSVQKHHTNKLPDFYPPTEFSKSNRTHAVPDTIEGWADALGILLATYMPHPEFAEWRGYNVIFDFSLIRPKGAPLSSGVGKAPGPEPLIRSLEIIKSLLDRCVADGQRRLRPIDAYDIIMHASDAVLSGGVRRSATICLFSPDDEEMATAKTGNWFNENPQRARANNSALLVRGETSFEEFKGLMQHVKEFGEPGFVWADSTELCVNPCVEIGMWPVCAETGESGWQFCNLCEINGKKCNTEEKFKDAAEAAAIIGTLQAGYTNFEYLGPVSERIVRRESLLGVSITGIQDNPETLLDPKLQRKMAKLVIKTNEEFAAQLNIPAAARCTCVKPAGTTSCILGTASGIHPHHATRYFRRIMGNNLEAPYQHFKTQNERAVERSVWSANKTDGVITFLVEVPKGTRTKNDLPALDLLRLVKETQQNWVSYGKVEERCTAPWLSHNVSNTINVKPDEWEEVTNFIYRNRRYFAGISLLPMSGDLDYPQAAMCAIHDHRQISSLYGPGSMFASGLIVDGLRAFDDDLWNACSITLNPDLLEEPIEIDVSSNGNGTLRIDRHTQNIQAREGYEAKKDWIRRAVQFAGRYFDGDVRQMTYCLKEVHNWKLWNDLQREYQNVDYTTLIEDSDETKITETVACAGGACEIF